MFPLVRSSLGDGEPAARVADEASAGWRDANRSGCPFHFVLHLFLPWNLLLLDRWSSERTDSGAGNLDLDLLCPLAMRPWARAAPLCLSFFFCERELKTVPNSSAYYVNELIQVYCLEKQLACSYCYHSILQSFLAMITSAPGVGLSLGRCFSALGW